MCTIGFFDQAVREKSWRKWPVNLKNQMACIAHLSHGNVVYNLFNASAPSHSRVSNSVLVHTKLFSVSFPQFPWFNPHRIHCDMRIARAEYLIFMLEIVFTFYLSAEEISLSLSIYSFVCHLIVALYLHQHQSIVVIFPLSFFPHFYARSISLMHLLCVCVLDNVSLSYSGWVHCICIAKRYFAWIKCHRVPPPPPYEPHMN